ncbi:hypothetical protein D3C73_1545580 [compost metagenome]
MAASVQTAITRRAAYTVVVILLLLNARRLIKAFNPSPTALRIKKHKPSAVVRCSLARLITALTKPPHMKIIRLPAEVEVPACCG